MDSQNDSHILNTFLLREKGLMPAKENLSKLVLIIYSYNAPLSNSFMYECKSIKLIIIKGTKQINLQ